MANLLECCLQTFGKQVRTLCFEDVTLQIVVRNGRRGRTASAYATKISLKHR